MTESKSSDFESSIRHEERKHYVHWLRETLQSDDYVNSIVSTYPTFKDLKNAPPERLVASGELGTVLVSRLPEVSKPPVPQLPGGVRSTVPDDQFWPFDPQRFQPPVVYYRGRLPSKHSLYVTGSEYPEPASMAAAADAGRVAATQGVTLIVDCGNEIGIKAASAAYQLGGSICIVLDHGFNVPHVEAYYLEKALESNGSFLTPHRPLQTISKESKIMSVRTATALCSTVFIVESSTEQGMGFEAIKTAVANNRNIIVPSLDTEQTLGVSNPGSFRGVEMMASPALFDPGVFGTNMKIMNRVHKGLPPADSVVSNTSQLAQAISGLKSEPV